MKLDFSTLPKNAPEYDLMTLLEAGCHFGHQKAKRHPRMQEYIYAEKDGVHIFDLAVTAKQLELAYNFVYDQASKGKSMVMVGTKRQAKDLIEEAATSCGANYITSRWLGGFLTNWTQVKKSLKRMIDIEAGLKTGKFDGYTKFEKVQLDKEKNKLARFFVGLRDLKKSPDFLFVVDIKREKNAIAEAKNMGIPVVAIVDTNSDPEGIDIVIPANDDALRSLSFLIKEVATAYKEGKNAAGKGAKPTPKPITVSTSTSTPAATPAPTKEVAEKPAQAEVKAVVAEKPSEKKSEAPAKEEVKEVPVKKEAKKTAAKKTPAKKIAKKVIKKAEVKTEAKKTTK